MKVLVMILFLSAAAYAEQPKPVITLTDVSLYAGVLASRSIDFITTEHVLAHGGKELILPKGLVDNKPAFAAYSIGFGFAECYIAHFIAKRGHRKMARGLLASDITFTSVVAAHNAAIKEPTK